MAQLGFAITEAIITEYGTRHFLSRLADPFWFQSFGAVMGMDWHSSGITTSVMGALKRAINPHSKELGIYICGGKGKFSKETPTELTRVSEKVGLDGNALIRCSKLSAKVDNTAIQDGFQLYTHNFIVNTEGDWSVVQQGMHTGDKTARRYHWHSEHVTSFVEEPHSGICGLNQGQILNLTAADAATTRAGIVAITGVHPDHLLKDFRHLVMPNHHFVSAADVNLKKLGSILWLAHEQEPKTWKSCFC